MSREMQYDSTARAVVHTLYGVWFNAQLQVFNGTGFVELSDGTATAANCCIALSQLESSVFYVANAPAAIDLTQPYTISYCDSAEPTLTGEIGQQAWDPLAAAIAANPAAVIAALITAGVLQYVSGSTGPLQLTAQSQALRPSTVVNVASATNVDRLDPDRRDPARPCAPAIQVQGQETLPGNISTETTIEEVPPRR
jgi:hypothetical protein